MSDEQKSDGKTRGIPPIAISQTTTRVNPTGSWKYVRPMHQDRVAPCNAGCPVGVDIEAYLNLLRDGRVDEAIDVLLRENPIPAITGRVCHHPCESSCNRQHFDEAVSIHAVERAVGDRVLANPLPAAPPRTRTETVAVVGSGPAGLACAYHLSRLGYGVTIYEEASEPGGMLRLGIPEYRLPREVLDRQIAWIEAHGVAIRCGVRVGDDVSWSDLGHDAVFIASGAHRPRAAGMEGERVTGVRAGLEFLKRVNAGGWPHIGRRVVVIGGGNTAIDCARTALRMGASPMVVYRRTRHEMPAIPQEIEEAELEGVEFTFLAAPAASRMVGGRLVGLECQRMELGAPDESGRRRPVPIEDGRFSVLADTVLTAIGEAADLESLAADLAHDGSAIAVDELGSTNQPAVFAGGDVSDAQRSVADALGSGKRAAIGLDRYLRTCAGEQVEELDLASLRWGPAGNVRMTQWRDDDPVRRASPVNELVEFDQLNPNHFHRVRRHEDQHAAPKAAEFGFTEANQGLTDQSALAEARRCLNCGVCNECELCLIFCPDFAITRRPGGGFDIDMTYCKGCGVCAAECPRGAIVMTREGV